MDELVEGMKGSLDDRVFVGVSRGVWDCVGRAIADDLCSLEDGDAAQVLYRRMMGHKSQRLLSWVMLCWILHHSLFCCAHLQRSTNNIGCKHLFPASQQRLTSHGFVAHTRCPVSPSLTGKPGARRGH